MSAILEFSGQRAVKCIASGSHSPTPLRFVWHHVQPEGAGGATELNNLVQICDSCHYTIHILLYLMAQLALGAVLPPGLGEILTNPPRKAQLAIAVIGYNKCVAAGTIPDIPNEGGVTI